MNTPENPQDVAARPSTIQHSAAFGSKTAPPLPERAPSAASQNPVPAELAVLHGGRTPEQRTLVDIITETVSAYPGAPAIDDGTVSLSYAELELRVQALARRLWAGGIGAGDRVGIYVPSGSVDLYIAILGVLYSGAAYVPVDTDEPAGRAETVWAEGGVCAVIEAGLELNLLQGVPSGGHSPQPHPEDDAWIIFTSGSTGKPKGVAVTHRSAAALVDAESSLYCVNAPLSPGDRVLAGLSVSFDASCEEMWLAWAHGACLVPAPRSVVRSGADLGPWLVERRITAVSTVPTLAAHWSTETLDRVRLLIFGGEACPEELVRRLAAPGREVWNTYGPTETTVIACGALLDGQSTVRIGLPLNGWSLAVIGEEGNPVRWGEVGELVIGGVGVSRYLDPEKDAEKFTPLPALGWERAYYSGDHVRADQEGLVFLGRVDEQIKLGGRRIELGEIDDALSRLPGVAAASAAVHSTQSGNRVLAGYLVPAAGATLDLGAARAQLAQNLPASIVPSLGIVDELPMKASGKVDRKALPWPLPVRETPTDVRVELNADLRWLGQRWTDLLGPLPLTEESDFFALGGASLAAAQLVSALRERYPKVSVADIYEHPTLSTMSDHLTSLRDSTLDVRETPESPWWLGLVQAPLIVALYGITGLRYVTGIAIVCMVMFHVVGSPWTPDPPVVPTLAAWLALYSLPARMVAAVVSSRLLLLGIGPGIYRRGGSTHLRLWAAERIVTYCKLEPIMGSPLGIWYARRLGCNIGEGVHLDAMPPVTGFASIGDRSSIEYEVDLAGHWIEGGQLHIGRVQIGEDVRIGARSTLMGGAKVGRGAETEPGTLVSGEIPANELWAGSQMRKTGSAGAGWPTEAAPTSESRRVRLLYPASLAGIALLNLLSIAPGSALMLWLLNGVSSFTDALWILAAWAPVFVVISMLMFLALTAAVVRGTARLMPEGMHPADGMTGWASWLSNVMLSRSLITMYPIYASVLTPVWTRLLGAKVGRHVEISTMETVPHLTRLEDRTFLADHSMVSARRVRQGWLHLGQASVAEQSFVGNSAIVGPDTHVPDNSLIAVLSSVPKNMPAGTSWFGRPAVELPRPVQVGDTARTYDPPRRLLVARSAVEACRILPAVITAWLALLTVWALAGLYDAFGFLTAVLWSGPVLLLSGIAAALIAVMAKWLLVGRFEASEHPLWSSFVWRNELADVFSESLAVPGLVRMSLGTPMLNAWLRWMGARIGRSVWCETWWLPEFDLIQVGDGASINRGTVLQTHLFHDRIMRLDEVTLGDGSTLGPNSIVLPGSAIEEGGTVGGCSLVMRGESVPVNSAWCGNPLAHWGQSRPMERRARHRKSIEYKTVGAGL
ncbi:amino acid adenylation domain-containing protein [Arthrobacter sp. zg-Y859]|uniref:Amino acid adenylation domain-containing protein n=1 Tax=Arthrobacter jinronghuae TaxID=2964609 RepID=A0ABT1NVZ1_9MICC|nr:Pls/PosA family non-ribosomal peptide synthetase [Arthrobacter jinronghuae]MCQ1951297.1 amino acid adenylation domain-containing protein [Arthrobacter jinronghuae]UWX78932.1 amino acid adenylation domain-containing protein [Arthrobacter jinronghuae]